VVIASGRTILLLVYREGILRVRVAMEILALEDIEDIEDVENVEKDVEELAVVVVEREDALLNIVL
jgi:hypothetical protein